MWKIVKNRTDVVIVAGVKKTNDDDDGGDGYDNNLTAVAQTVRSYVQATQPRSRQKISRKNKALFFSFLQIVPTNPGAQKSPIR